MGTFGGGTTFCANCGAQLVSGSAFCSRCGASADGLGAVGGVRMATDRTRRRYSLPRVGVLGLVTLGLYPLYWMYMSWKQLSTETTGRDHHPFWHVMAISVPIYGLFVLYNHFATIKSLQEREGLPSSIKPGWVVAVAMLAGVVSLYDNSQFDVTVLTFVGPWIWAAGAVWGQANLNAYWDRVTGGQSRSASAGPGEIITSVIGVVLTGLVLVGTTNLFLEPSVPSVFHAGAVTPLEIGSPAAAVIETNLNVDAFSFEARAGERYVIETGFGPGDPLEDSLMFLWDTDGTAVIEGNDDFRNTFLSRIEWTAPRDGTYYVTVENADFFSTGAYTLTVRRAE